MKTHDVKLVSDFYDDSASGAKPFEIRKADRDYQVGDYLRLHEIKVMGAENSEEFGIETIIRGYQFTGRSHVKVITYILPAEKYPEGINEDYVILGVRPVMSQEEIKAREEMWGWHE